MTFDPPLAIANMLDADSGLELTLGTNLFASMVRAASSTIPINAVFVYGAPGTPVLRVMGDGSEIRRPVVLVRVRWGSFVPGLAKMRAIQDFLVGNRPSGYLDIYTLQSEPDNLGSDSLGYHMWSLGVSVAYNNVAS